MLVDGGGSYDDRFDVGRYVVAPFLWHERIGKIDTVVLTHPHPDHVNGLPYILDNFDVKEVWTNGDEAIVDWGAALADKMKQKGIAHRLLTSKSAPIDMGGVRIGILNPGKGPPADADLSDREINERALVMQLRWGEAAFLLPSDIGEPTESAARRPVQDPGKRGPACPAPRLGLLQLAALPAGRPARNDRHQHGTARPRGRPRAIPTDGGRRLPHGCARGHPHHYGRPALRGCTLQKPMNSYCLSGVNVLAIQVQIPLLGAMAS